MDIWKQYAFYDNMFSDQVTYLCNQPKRFEQIWKGTAKVHSCELWSVRGLSREDVLGKMLIHDARMKME